MSEERRLTEKGANDIAKFEERHQSGSAIVPIDNSPAALMQVAMSKGMDLDKLEKMLDLQTKWEERESKKAYTKAMSSFKADPPSIYKDKTNKQFGSKYSSIDALVNPAIPHLSKYGLSHSWNYGEPDPKQVVVTCTITHELGHSESVTMSGPPDTSGGGSKNPIQQIKSTQTYLKIATFEAVTGLVSQEANLNDDGNSSIDAFITDDQRKEFEQIVLDKKIDTKQFFKYMRVEETATILAKDYNKGLTALKKAKGRN